MKKKEKDYQDILKSLKKGDIASPLIFCGKEKYLKDFILLKIKEKYIEKGFEHIDYISLEGDVTLEELEGLCTSYPMISNKKVIVIEESKLLKEKGSSLGKNKKERLLNLIKGVERNRDFLLIFLAESVDKKLFAVKKILESGELISFDKITEREFRGFVLKRIDKERLKISKKNLDYLVDLTGYFNVETTYNLYTASNDIKKIIDLTLEKGKKEVALGTITWGISSSIELYIFSMLNDILQNKKDEALTKLKEHIKNGENVRGIIGSIISQMEVILMVSEMIDKGYSTREIFQKTKFNEYRIKKVSEYARGFGIKKCKEILFKAYQMEEELILGILEDELAVELFVANI